MIFREARLFTQCNITWGTNISCIVSNTEISPTVNTNLLWVSLSFCWRNFNESMILLFVPLFILVSIKIVIITTTWDGRIQTMKFCWYRYGCFDGVIVDENIDNRWWIFPFDSRCRCNIIILYWQLLVIYTIFCIIIDNFFFIVYITFFIIVDRFFFSKITDGFYRRLLVWSRFVNVWRVNIIDSFSFFNLLIRICICFIFFNFSRTIRLSTNISL